MSGARGARSVHATGRMRPLLLVVPSMLLAACGGSTASPGAGSDAAPPDASIEPEPDAACCLSRAVAWEPNGGLVAWTSASSLEACRRWTYRRTRSDGSSPTSCSAEIPSCGEPSIGVTDVERALADADVAAALGASTPLYGSDPRPCDGAVLRVTVGERTFDVGGACGQGCGPSAEPCVAVPPGVAALVETLRKLDDQELATSACAGLPR